MRRAVSRGQNRFGTLRTHSCSRFGRRAVDRTYNARVRILAIMLSPILDPLPLAGRVALVTGAATGIGRAAALAFAVSGARVVVSTDTDVEGGEATVAT